MRMVGQYVEGTNIVGLIVWSFILGLFLNRMGEEGRIIVDILTAVNEATKCAVNLILRLDKTVHCPLSFSFHM